MLRLGADGAMNHHSVEPAALFLSPDGNIYLDTLICSGIIPGELMRLFKCRMWLWLVVPGLYDATRSQLRHITEE
jgi:hypothetical protein